MERILELIKLVGDKAPIAKTIAIVIVAYLVLDFILIVIKKGLLKRTKTKKQKSNVEIFSKVINYTLIIILVLFTVSSLGGSWAGLGIGLGLLSAALGWALQRPITGIAAWIMIITKRPFEIGDRVIIGDTKGDVIDISLTHVHLGEVGGTISSEENSGRVILIPNSILFEQKIINYTLQDEYILDQAVTLVTYESNFEKAKKICLDATKKFFDKNIKDGRPYIRIVQGESGIEVKARYKVKAVDRIEVFSNINNEIITNISKTKDVQIALPHREIILRKK